jgi:hypothetical protein
MLHPLGEDTHRGPKVGKPRRVEGGKSRRLEVDKSRRLEVDKPRRVEAGKSRPVEVGKSLLLEEDTHHPVDMHRPVEADNHRLGTVGKLHLN